MDDNGHGTVVAGIIGSSNPNDPGIAPDVNLIALKVLDANMNGTWANIDAGLQWVIAHKTQYNIVAVNLSLGSGNYTTDPYDLLETDLANLKALGVFTAVASGNNYYTYGSQQGLAYPAVDPDVVSVGATWAGSDGAMTWNGGATDYSSSVDQIISITQRDSSLDLLAPGAWITSDGLDNTMLTEGGTSMATAVVTGSAVLLHEAYDQTGQGTQATEANILKLMQSTGVSIVDANNGVDNVQHTGLTFKRLNLLAAMTKIGQPVAPPTLAPIANQTLTTGQTILVPLTVTNPAGSTLTYSATEIYLPALAYQLDQKYGFQNAGSYNTNLLGLDEKWIEGNGSVWYCILPDGELRRYAGSAAQTLLATNLIATLDPSFWTDPSKLWNAPYAGMPPAVFSFKGNTLSVRSPAAWLGTFSVMVTISNAQYSVQQTFNVTEAAASPPPPAATPPVLTPIANQTMAHSLHTLALPLSATETGSAAITYSAQVLPSNGQTPAVGVAVQGTQLTISPALSVVGAFTIQVGASNTTGSVSETFTVTVTNSAPVLGPLTNVTASHGQDTLVTLSATDADNDALTYTAKALPLSSGLAAPLAVTVQGTQLTIHPTQPAVGTYTIQVSVTDGAATTTGTFTITLTNTAPTLAAISPQTMATGQTSLTVPLTAGDADHDTLTFQTAAETPSAQAYQLDQKYGFTQYYGSYYTNRGQDEREMAGRHANSVWYFLSCRPASSIAGRIRWPPRCNRAT